MSYAKVPDIKTTLPGPKAAAAIKLDKEFISTSYTRDYPMVIVRGKGLAAEDIDGNIFLDFTAGIAVNCCGFSHPEIVKTIQEAAARFQHMSGTDFYYPSQAKLAAKLAEHTPGDCERRVFFCNSGTEANECAIKLSRWFTGRQTIISFRGAFHGRTYGSMSISCSKGIHRTRFGPLMASVVHANYPYPYRAAPHLDSPEKVADDCLAYIEEGIFKREVLPDEVAAIFVEAVQGEGGYIVPPDNWLPGLRRICDQHGILLVFDEVQSGMGRTGKFFAHEHWGVHGDIICTAKGIAAGIPLGAVIARRDVMTWPPGSHASTFGGNPIACSTALKVIELLEGGLMANAAEVGAYLKNKLELAVAENDRVGEVRGKGLMVALEFVKDRAGKAKDPEARNAVVQACFKRGLLVLGCGENNLRLCPPLVVTREEADIAVNILNEAISAAL